MSQCSPNAFCNKYVDGVKHGAERTCMLRVIKSSLKNTLHGKKLPFGNKSIITINSNIRYSHTKSFQCNWCKTPQNSIFSIEFIEMHICSILPEHIISISKMQKRDIISSKNCPAENFRRVYINNMECREAVDRIGHFICYQYERVSRECCQKCLAVKRPNNRG